MRSLFAALAVVLLVPCSLAAQQPPAGRIEGEIRDSLHARPLVGALVMLTRMDPQPSQYFSAVTDDRGRYHFDTLTAGRYSVAYTHEFLDSLSLAVPGREVTLAADQRERIDFGLPSAATLRAAACPGLQLPAGRGAVVGQASDADTEQPLRRATVAVSWTEVGVDRATLRPQVEPRSGAVQTDSLGQFRLCGVPTDTYLFLQLQRDGRAGSALQISVPEDVGVAVRNLSLSASASRPIAALDSTAGDDTTAVPPLRGTATLTGTVRAPGGQPLTDAEVRVLEADQPAGTQLAEVRRVGYLLGKFPVELRSGHTVDQSMQLTRIVSLDSIRIVARRGRYREFDARARRKGFGTFLTEQQIEQRHAIETSDLLGMSGMRIVGTGLDTKVVSGRGQQSIMLGPCYTNIVIDGIQHQDINLVRPEDIGAMEIYKGQGGTPIEYDASCGVVVIHTKR
jgi:hypothetical protein